MGLKLPYYAGLLTAAQYHGAAHQRPQEFQVFLERARRPIRCGRVRVHFIVRKNLQKVPVQRFNTPRGTVQVSTPEATALDLVGYHHHAGGLNQVATVLMDLAERIEPKALAAAAAAAPVPWAQRLGYLLELTGAGDRADALKAFVRARAHESTLLVPKKPRGKAARNEDWKLFLNTEVEVDL
jgi:predicted transcriptional regulator of viral defense system